MKLCILLVFATLLAFITGMPPISRDYNNRCHCLQVESRIIPPDNLKMINLIPKGPHCPEVEVVANLVNGAKVCLNPKCTWVKKLVQFVLGKQLSRKRATLPKA